MLHSLILSHFDLQLSDLLCKKGAGTKDNKKSKSFYQITILLLPQKITQLSPRFSQCFPLGGLVSIHQTFPNRKRYPRNIVVPSAGLPTLPDFHYHRYSSSNTCQKLCKHVMLKVCIPYYCWSTQCMHIWCAFHEHESSLRLYCYTCQENHANDNAKLQNFEFKHFKKVNITF